MSVKIKVELHPCSREKTILETSSKSIAEIIKELNSGFALSQARVCRNGEIVKDFSLTAKDDDTLDIKFIPQGSPQSAGIGMKVGGWALVIAGIAVSWTGIGSMVGAVLIGTGLSMALGGAVLMNVNVPKLKDREKPESDPSLRGSRNQARPHGRIPVLLGRHRIYPDMAANQHTEIQGNSQYLIQLFCGGYKDYTIDLDSIKLGDTPLIDLSRTKDIRQILCGADPVIKLEILQNGEASNLYPRCVHEDALNALLQHEVDGEDGNKISGEIICTTPDNTESINVDIFFLNGLGRYNDDGDISIAHAGVNVFFKPSDEPDSSYQLLGFFDGSQNNVFYGMELKTLRFQVTSSKLPKGRYTVKIVRIFPDSDDSKVIDQVYVGSIRSFKSSPPVNPNRQKDLTIIAFKVMATAKLNGLLDSFNYIATSKLPVFSGGGSGYLNWLNVSETRNPASALVYALRGRAAQQQVDTSDIDWASIEAFYSWCEKHNYTFNAYLSEALTIAELISMIGNSSCADILRIDSKISVVQDIERPSHVQLFTPKNTISYSITMFQSDIPDALALRYTDEEAGFAQNELTVYNTPDGNRLKEPLTIQKIDLFGVTDSVQARRIGMYNYACLNNRPFVHLIEVDLEYLMCNKGDLVQYAGDVALTGSVQGRIKGVVFADDVCVGIDTDEPVIMTEGQNHAVRIRLSNGSIIIKEVVFSRGIPIEKAITYYPVKEEGADLHEPSLGDMYVIDEDNNIYYEPQNLIIFIEPLADPYIPKAGDIYAFGVRGYEVLDLIITDIQPGQNLCASLTCVEYSPEIFGVDDPDFILPAFENRITPVSGAIDSGVVNPDRWKFFAVYSDLETEPSRPEGDGQGNGWHLVQTWRSVWQSTKMSESIESGEWGSPVRIKAQRGLDDVTPIWLSLTPQNITLDTDGDGNILAGLLPLTVQARLHHWNTVLQGASFSLLNAPEGFSVNASSGLVTVSANAALSDVNNITVRAEYKSGTYSLTLVITKDLNSYAPRYLGTIKNLASASNALVEIIKGTVQGQVRARQGDFVLAIASVNGRQAGSVFQWTGEVWEYRSPNTHTDLYLRCYKDGFEVPELTYDMAWFGAVFAKLLVAQQAFIEELAAQVITLKNGGVIKSDKYDSSGGTLGWMIDFLGNAFFNNATVRGRVEANSGTFINGLFSNISVSGDSVFSGSIFAGPIIATDEQTGLSTQHDFPASTNIRNIRDALSGGGTVQVFSNASYGTLSGIATIEIDSFIWNNRMAITLRIRINNGTTSVIEGYEPNYATIPNRLTLAHTSGKTFRILNLPVSGTGTGYPTGTVYRDTAGNLKIAL